MQPQVGELLLIELEHEARREAVQIAIDLLVKPLGRLAIERRQVGIQHHPLAPDQVDALGDLADGQGRAYWGGRHRRHDKPRWLASGGASTDSWFDANGFLVATDRSESTPDKPLGNALVNDAQGRVLHNNQGAARPFDTNTAGFGRIENQAGGFIGGFIGNDSNRGHVQRQLIVNGEVLARYGDELVAKLNSTEFTPTSVAEFQFGAAPLNVRQSNLDAQRYTVSDGETLRSIARSFYGDDKLWYLIAQANGLSGSTQLSTGQTLSIPKLAASSNAADSFKPYDPSKVVGDLTPNLPMPHNDKGCGGLGQIIMAAVAIVVTVFAPYLIPALGAMNPVVAAAASAALGSVASQVVGNAIGAVDGFSWKQVALSAVSAGVGAGLPSMDLGLGATGNLMVRAAVGNAITQGIGVVTGLQKSFDWKGVAASAVATGVGQAVGRVFGEAFGTTAAGQFGARFATGLVAGTAAAAMCGGKVAIQQVATDAFGNALGGSLVEAMMPQNSAQESFRLAEISQQNSQANLQPQQTTVGSAGGKTFAQDVTERKAAAQAPEWARDPQGSAALSLLKDAQGVLSGDVWAMGSPPFGAMARLGQTRVIDGFNFGQRSAYENVRSQPGGSTEGAIAAAQLVGLKQQFDALTAGLSSAQATDPNFVRSRSGFNDMLLAYDSYFVHSVPELMPADTSRVRGKALVSLAPGALYDDANTGFSASLYKNRQSGHYTLAFRGTANPEGVDADYTQALGQPTKQYDQAVDLALELRAALRDNLSFAGHSLGGGLASIAALKTDLQANTFNAAGLNPATVHRYQAAMGKAPALINAYFVRGEALSAAQDAGPVKMALPTAYASTLPYPRVDLPHLDPTTTRMSMVDVDLPEAVGQRIGLTPSQPASPLALHGSSAVLEALYRAAFPGRSGRP